MLKKFLLLMMVLVLLLGGAVMFAPSLIPPETIKTQLISRVEAATGRKMTIDGPLSLSFFPVVSVLAQDVTLSNPDGFGDKPFVALGELRANVALMPLLHKDIQINRFVLKKPVIALAVDKSGRENWVFSAPEVQQGLSKEPLDEAPKTTEEGFSPSALRLSDLEISDGTLSYRDARTGANYTLEEVNAKLALSDMASPLNVTADARWQGQKVNLGLMLDSLASTLEGKPGSYEAHLASDLLRADAKGALEGKNFTAKASLSSPSLKKLKAWVQPKGAPMGTPATLALEVSSNMKCAGADCTISDLMLTLDHLQARGSADVNASGSTPKVKLALATGKLDITPFLPAQEPQSGWLSPLVGEAHALSPRWSTEPIDLSFLKAADVDAVIDTQGIVFRQFVIGAAKLAAKVSQGKLTANVKDAVLYDGTGSIALSAGAGAYGLDAALSGIALEKMLSDAAGMDRLAGNADIRFNSKASGNSQAQIISSLSGSGDFKVANGRIQRVNLLDMLRNVTAAFGAANTGGATEFSQMSGSFSINQGVISNNDLLIAMQGMRVNGQGAVNLPDYTINYRLSPQTYSTRENAEGQKVTREGVQVPVLISGSLDGPQFQPDTKALLKDALSNPEQFKEQLINSRKDIKEQLKQPKETIKNIKGLLKGLKN